MAQLLTAQGEPAALSFDQFQRAIDALMARIPEAADFTDEHLSAEQREEALGDMQAKLAAVAGAASVMGIPMADVASAAIRTLAAEIGA